MRRLVIFVGMVAFLSGCVTPQATPISSEHARRDQEQAWIQGYFRDYFRNPNPTKTINMHAPIEDRPGISAPAESAAH